MIDTLLPLAAAVEGQNAITELLHNFGIDLPYLLSQIVSFGVVAFLLYKFAFKPVLATMDDRNSKIAGGLKYADEMKAKLADAEKQHTEAIRKAALEAQKIIEEARASAKTLLDRETAQATEKTQQMLTKAEQAIELERRKMIADVREEISRLVALTAQRVLSRELGAEEKKRYTESAARELTSV